MVCNSSTYWKKKFPCFPMNRLLQITEKYIYFILFISGAAEIKVSEREVCLSYETRIRRIKYEKQLLIPNDKCFYPPASFLFIFQKVKLRKLLLWPAISVLPLASIISVCEILQGILKITLIILLILPTRSLFALWLQGAWVRYEDILNAKMVLYPQ